MFGFQPEAVLAVLLFLITYVLIITEKYNRGMVAIIAAMLAIILGLISFEVAMTEYVEWDTIFLLIGMMLIANITMDSGIFDYLAIYFIKKVKGKSFKILIVVALFTVIGSAFLDNVTTILLMIPITLSITKLLGKNPIPYLIATILFSNIGGMLTLIGDPVNIIIASSNPQLSFMDFIINMFVPVVLSTIAAIGILFLFYKKEFTTPSLKVAEIQDLDPKSYIKNKTLAKKSVIVLIATVIGFFFHSILHVPPSVIAMLGAAVLVLITAEEEADIHHSFAKVEWIVIFFLIGLFIVIGALAETGVIATISDWLSAIAGDSIQALTLLVLVGGGILSGILENVIVAATMVPILQETAMSLGVDPTSDEFEPVWWALLVATHAGGNMTIIASSTGIVALEMSKKEGYHIRFWEFMKVGVLVGFSMIIISGIYLMIRFF